jgi:oxygen-independent coproporphyrinogen-3 oxidase
MYLTGMERFEAAGYKQYEISNVARRGRESRHNVKYWTGEGWQGFGCGAHSTRGGRRWKNVAAAAEYVARIAGGISPAVDCHELSDAERLSEALFMGLRLTRGVDLDAVAARHGSDAEALWRRYAEQLMPFVDAGVLRRQDGRLWLTRPGMLLANEVMAVFV